MTGPIFFLSELKTLGEREVGWRIDLQKFVGPQSIFGEGVKQIASNDGGIQSTFNKMSYQIVYLIILTFIVPTISFREDKIYYKAANK